MSPSGSKLSNLTQSKTRFLLMAYNSSKRVSPPDSDLTCSSPSSSFCLAALTSLLFFSLAEHCPTSRPTPPDKHTKLDPFPHFLQAPLSPLLPPSLTFSCPPCLPTVLFSPSDLLCMYIYIQGCSVLLGEGNGNPLQYSCLENPIVRGA